MKTMDQFNRTAVRHKIADLLDRGMTTDEIISLVCEQINNALRGIDDDMRATFEFNTLLVEKFVELRRRVEALEERARAFRLD